MALDTRGLASGFGQGFGLMDNYYRGQKQDDRAERGQKMSAVGMGAGVGMMAGMQPGAVGGPMGMAIGAGIGLLASSIF